MLNDAEIKIIITLLNSSEPLQCSFLSERLKLSTRTIKHDIKQINEENKAKNLAILSNTHTGYWIPAEEKASFMNVVYHNDRHSTFPSTQNRRVFNIGCHILKHPSGTSSFQNMADLFYVSKSTISNDIEFLKDIADASGDVHLKTKKTGGIAVEGSERALRHFYASLVTLFYDIDNSYIKRCVMETFSAVHTATPLHDILIHSLAGQGIQLSDTQMTILTFQIIFSAYRIQNGHELREAKKYSDNSPAWLSSIEHCMNVSFNHAETSYLISQVEAVCGIQTGKEEYNSVQNAITHWHEHIKEEYDLDLSHNRILNSYIIQLVNHSDISSDLIIYDQTILDQTFALALAKGMCVSLARNNLSVLDTGSLLGLTSVLTIVLNQHVPKLNAILLIDTEEGIRQYDAYRLKERFSTRINMLGAYPLYQVNDISLFKECDFILCTSRSLLEWSTYASAVQKISKDIIFINPALSETDMHKIEQYLLSFMPSRCGTRPELKKRRIIE